MCITKSKLFWLLAFVLLGTGLLFAQENKPAKDNELWTGFVIKHKLNNQFRIEIEQQTRLNNNWSDVKSTFYEMGLRYKISDYFYLKPQVRFVIPRENRNRYRMSLDAGASYKLDSIPVKFYYRARLQNTTVTYTKENLTFLRNQVGVSYKCYKWLSVYTEVENFYRFNSKNESRGYRLGFGTEWRLNKKADITLFYQIDTEENVNFPEQQNIFGAKLSVSI